MQKLRVLQGITKMPNANSKFIYEGLAIGLSKIPSAF